ncbi:hypothetical protein CVT24_012412 [Panaeolus cyanescens]|uniref:G-protein coupled receptors family 1 profile domain-containing protein n=1 Tax=Panaeolus cyanescens TaxID=181874 RepID=A0A409YJB9_9AGAR|nr:hypothetical protein CVT24_012412 [Panaeolus cyanescens]
MNPAEHIPKKWMILLHIFPILTSVVTLLEVIIVGLTDRKSVVADLSGMYCHISSQIPNRITSGLTIICVIGVLIMDVLIIRVLKKMWKEHQRAVRPLSLETEEHISLDSIVRVVIFAFLPTIALVVSCSQYFPGSQEAKTSAKTNIVVATLPVAAFLIFGSQKDMLRAWGLCRRPKEIHWQRKGVSDEVTE